MESFYSKLKDFCQNSSTVVEYFLIVGINHSSLRENIEEHHILTPLILSQFPPFNRNEVLIPESIPIFCFPWGMNISKTQQFPSVSYLLLTDEKGNKLFCTSLKIWELAEEPLEETESTVASKRSYSFLADEIFYVPKCIVIVSKLAFFETFERILYKIYKLTLSPILSPIEWFIGHLVLLVPTPPRGHLRVEYKLGDLDCDFKLPPLNKLPLLDINLGCLFTCLSLENIIKVFTCLALEQSTVFLSANDSHLSSCSMSLLSLLFPFQWSLVCVPILPELLLDYLYSPVSYVYGLNIKSKEEVYIRGNESLFIVDLDNNSVYSNAQSLKISNERFSPTTIPPLPLHYAKKLNKRLQKILDAYEIQEYKIFTSETCENIRDAFFQFFVAILKSYKKFMNFSSTVENGSCFDETGFIKDASDNAKGFFSRFFKTQMFANFCETRIRPLNIEEHSESLLFDEHILAKLNRSKLRYSKYPTPFINDTSQIWKTSYKVPEITVLAELRNFTYGIFPDFSFEVFGEYPLPREKPPKYSESIDFPYSSHSEITQKHVTEEEMVYLCWIEIWASCLWYQDENEHNLRFKELISTLRALRKVSTSALTSSYKILLEASARVNPSLGMPIFKEMTDSQVMVDAATVHLLQRILSLSIKKDQKHAVKNTGNSIFYTNSLINDNFMPNTYRRRVFTKAGDHHIFAKQELCFLIKETCKKCHKFLSIAEIKSGWQNTAYIFESTCPGCKEKYIPSLRIRIGLEVGHDQKTSNRENTIFVSPITLRSMIKDLLDDPIYKFRLEIDLMRIYNAIIFWNLIWHFNNLGLPFEFMLPYEQEVIDVKNSFVIVGEEIGKKVKVDKETQTDWNLVNIDQAIRKYNETISKNKDV